jgi:hypothetical protein
VTVVFGARPGAGVVGALGGQNGPFGPARYLVILACRQFNVDLNPIATLTDLIFATFKRAKVELNQLRNQLVHLQ